MSVQKPLYSQNMRLSDLTKPKKRSPQTLMLWKVSHFNVSQLLSKAFLNPTLYGLILQQSRKSLGCQVLRPSPVEGAILVVASPVQKIPSR